MTLSSATPIVMPPPVDVLTRPRRGREAHSARTPRVAAASDVADAVRRPAVAIGGLDERRIERGPVLVRSRDASGRTWWIPAAAVFVDGVFDQPCSIGLARGRHRDLAVLAGLSDRLGWEAKVVLERGGRLPVIDDLVDTGGDTVVYDGRLDHDVPTVVIASPQRVLAGAGSTLATALRRALYGEGCGVGSTEELDDVVRALGVAGLDVGVVDLATSVMSRVGLHRLSVQLLPSHEPGRPWDARPVY